MDNALVIDGVIAGALLLGAVIGAARGLFKSLMGFVAVAAALVGAVVLADLLTPLVTELVYPGLRDAALTVFAAAENAAAHGFEASETLARLEEQLGRFGLSAGGLNPALSVLTLAEQAARTLIAGVVHAVLLVLLYVVLLLVLKLLTGALDHVFDLPVLSTLNGALGALFGICEAAVLVYVAAYAALHLGVRPVAEHAGDALLLSFFLNHSPIELIAGLGSQPR